MRKWNTFPLYGKRTIIITIALMILGCMICGIGFSLADYDIYNLNPESNVKFIKKEKTIPLQNINTIAIDVSRTNITIEQIDGDAFQLQYEEKENDPLKLEATENKLSLESSTKVQRMNFGWMNFINDSNTMNMKLQIPKNYIGDLDIYTTYGKLKIGTIEGINELRIANEHGNINAENMNASNIHVSNSYGDTMITSMKSTTDFYIENEHANIEINTIDAQEIEVINSYGRINLRDAKSSNEFIITNEHDDTEVQAIEAEKISITNSYGLISSSQLISQSDIVIENEHGEVNLRDLQASNFNTTASYSIIQITAMKVENNIYISNEHDDITLTNIQSKNSELESSYGDVKLKDWSSDQFTSNLEHGNLSGEIIGNESDFHILTSVEHGENNLANETNKEKEKMLNFTVNYGDININFKNQ